MLESVFGRFFAAPGPPQLEDIEKSNSNNTITEDEVRLKSGLLRASFHSDRSDGKKLTPAEKAMVLHMVRQGYEREVAVICLREVRFRSVSAAVDYLKRVDPMSGKLMHTFLTDDIDRGRGA